ncbi:glycosyltransferase [Puia dinghuensis]|uniref:Glycosyltransferase n=1 Tax=Puia dinghuensis TaxID=1792502 RepID=A0A8J2UGY3_9BACT|nr:glycosyltransferase family 2 protein [Puia dinghuensis]GGB16013.1 hypothetical protein GCM10011511_44830 [Puia dinghuensis]
MQKTLLILWGIYLAYQVFLASYLVQPFLLLLIYSVSKALGIRPRSTPYESVTRDYQFGIIITAHQSTEFIPPIVDSLLKQTYDKFNVYVVADDCDVRQLRYFDPRIHILVPPAPLHDQVASLEYGLRQLSNNDEVVVIFDPDNLAHPDFLRVLNVWYNNGFRAVYGHMQSKNKSTTYAQIDNWGAALSNFMERDMRSLLGLSVNISGSGISVHKAVYGNIQYDQRSRTGGFDKHLQIDVAKGVDRIAFAREAIFYDEKVSDAGNFERQRIRWIAAHFKFLGNAFGLLFTGLRRFDFNLIYFGYNLIRPPYFLLMAQSFACMVIDWFILRSLSVAWFIAFTLFALSFLVIVAKESKGRSIIDTIQFIPRIFYRQLRALLKLRVSKKKLLKTENTHVVYIDEVIVASSAAPPVRASS